MTPEFIKRVCKALAVVCVAIGGFGSLSCFSLLMTNHLYWIATAGIYFVAGAVMIVGGLVTYTLLMKVAK